MKLSYQTTRSVGASPLEVVRKKFNVESLDDAVCLDFIRKIYLGVRGLSHPCPIIARLIADYQIETFLKDNTLENEILLLTIDKNSVSLNSNNGIINLPLQLSKKIIKISSSMKSYGGHLNNDGSITIDLLSDPVGPHYGVNLLLGWREGEKDALLSTPKSVVDQFGRGSFRAQAGFQVLATRWDIRPEENGNPFNRQFYILENGKQIFYSANIKENVKKAVCTHYQNRSVIEYVLKDGIKVTRTIFLLAQEKGLPDAAETQIVRISSNKKRKLKIVFTGTFGFSNPDCQQVDVIYQTVIHQSETITDENGNLVALSPCYYPEYFKRLPRFVTLISNQGFADGFCNDSTAFLGNGDICHPEHLAHLDNEYKVKGASFFALEKEFIVDENKPFDVSTIIGMVNAEGTKDELQQEILKEKLDSLLTRYPNVEKLEEKLIRQCEFLDTYSSYFQVNSGDKRFDAMINKNVPFQVLYQSFVSRAFAQTQKGYREIGFREVQDLYASIPYLVSSGHTLLAEECLENWIKNVYKMGYSNHNFYYVGKEPGMCSDDSLWLLEAVCTYIDVTGNVSFLNKEFDVADGGKRSLIDTIDAIITYSSRISIGKHGLPLLDKADWNDCLRIDDDCLDGPTKEKLYKIQLEKNNQQYGVPFENDFSESVMNAFLLVIALDKAKKLATYVGNQGLAIKAEEYKETLVQNIKKSCFINGYYARVLINREKPLNGISYVGAPGDKLSTNAALDNGSLYLNTLSWSILSGVASEEEIKSMIVLADTFLKTPSGYKLCSDEDLTLTGAKQSATSHYFPGDRENGGVFKHATMMLARALLMGAKRDYKMELKEQMIEDAYFMLRLVYPFHNIKNPYLYKGNPRFCTQYNNSITQENIGPILSGTATWLTLSIWEGLGVDVNKDYIKVNPCLPYENNGIKYCLKLNSCIYDVTIKKPKNQIATKVKSYRIDGKKVKTDKIPMFSDKKVHHVVCELE